jgi:hypothetical protein
MDRRLFVKLSAASAAVIGFSLLEGCHFRRTNNAISTPDLLSHVLDKETLNDIGKKYLTLAPNEKNEDDLVAKLLEGSKIDASSDGKVITTFLTEQITNDFREGRTLIVSGWILSLTEARQCALFYLINK